MRPRNPRFRNGGTRNQYANGMIFDTTVVRSKGGRNNGLYVEPADAYFSLSVDTTDPALVAAGVPVDVILFDASQGYQLSSGVTNAAQTIITGLTSNYQFMLNDISHNSSYVTDIKLRVTSGSSVTQFARNLSVYNSTKGKGTGLIDTLHPESGVDEHQYNDDIVTFLANLVIDNRRAIVYKQDPGIVTQWSFYQGAELGRKI